MSKREQLLRRVIQALKDAPGAPASLKAIHRQPYRAWEQEDLDAIAVYLADNPLMGLTETVERLDMDPGVERQVNFVLELRVQASEPDRRIDELYVWAVRTIMTDAELAEIVHDLEERTSRGFQQRDAGRAQGIGRAEVHFVATLHTAEDDPSTEDFYDA